MGRVRIVTDGTAQFTQPDFTGHELVHLVNLPLREKTQESRLSPPGNGGAAGEHPGTREIVRTFDQLMRGQNNLLVLSSSLTEPGHWCDGMLSHMRLSNTVQLIETHTFAVGLGLLVQLAAGLAAAGAELAEIENSVRMAIPTIYTVYCIPNLTHLADAGYLSRSQALVGGMLGIMPIFSFEDGRFVLVDKVRTPRHVLESFQEFLSEFIRPAWIAIVRGNHSLRPRFLREYISSTFPGTGYNEYHATPALERLFGSQAIGLVVMDAVES